MTAIQTAAKITHVTDRDSLQEYLLTIADAADCWYALLDAVGLPPDASVADVLALDSAAEPDADEPEDDAVAAEYLTIPTYVTDGFRRGGVE